MAECMLWRLKTVSTLGKTVGTFVFSKVLTVFSKLPSVFGVAKSRGFYVEEAFGRITDVVFSKASLWL